MPSDLTNEQVASFLGEHPQWSRNGASIRRTFELGDFVDALRFVVRVGSAAEAADHHPDIDIRWNKVTLVLSTHAEGALTSKDLDLAATIDAIAA